MTLAEHYTHFQVSQRLLLTGHSHQAWPDVALDGQLEAFRDAAECIDGKWERAFAKADRVREGYRVALGDPGADLALGASTHDLVLRFLSAMDLPRRRRLVTTDGEFHTLRRQLTRLAEESVQVVRVAAQPVETLAQRLGEAIDDDTAAVLVSAVLFETARIVPGLDELARVCQVRGTELLIDAYHALGALPVALPESAWVVGGGYKYLQLGEGNCVLRVPPHAARSRPVITGWYAEFEELAEQPQPGQVGYGRGAAAFIGATYDPTSHYRAARVFDFFAEQGLTPQRLREISRRQTDLLCGLIDQLDLPASEVDRDRTAPRTEFGGFLALRCAHAAGLQRGLLDRGVRTDSRGEWLRLGPAPYVTDQQLETSVGLLGEVVRQNGRLG